METERYSFLLVQRAVLQRAIHRARENRADNDAEILQTIVLLLEELYDIFPRTRRAKH